MKKLMTCFLSMALAVVMLFSFAGCFGNSTPEDTTPKEYTIQYTDDVGTHQLTVTAGMPYSLDVVPTKNGYEFMGLYDAEVGGTQYISSSGASLSPFNDSKNMVLFPQFKAKDYTVILDYQGAPVTGSRQLTVAYGSSLPELPKNLTGEHKEFAGWYTEADCGGTQIADQYGLIPLVSVLNEQNFDLSGTSVTLYAGFETEKHTVTFCFEAGMDTEDMQVAYDTPISQVVPKTRVEGNAVLTWSKTQGGEVWNGKVTDNMVLYAVEYAPVIELDTNGGNKVNSVVARAGSTISLPTPTKDMAKFAYWEDMQGNEYTSTTMPGKSISLKAVWQAKIVFDENGGSDVDDISVASGESITLPIPEKEGFIFAGWYTAEKEEYTSKRMPSAGIALKAGWYKSKVKNVIIKIDSNSSNDWTYAYVRSNSSTGPKSDWGPSIDLSNELPASGGTISITYHYDMKADTQGTTWDFGIYLYDNAVVSDAYYLTHKMHNNFSSTVWQTFTYSTTVTLKANALYIRYYAFRHSDSLGSTKYIYLKNIYADISYPDTTNLYL